MERSDGLWLALAVALWVALLLFFVQQGTLRFVFLATVLLLGMLLARRERGQRATRASWAGRDQSEWAHIAAAVRKEQADRVELWLRHRLEETSEHEDAWVTRKNLARLLMSLGRLAEASSELDAPGAKARATDDMTLRLLRHEIAMLWDEPDEDDVEEIQEERDYYVARCADEVAAQRVRARWAALEGLAAVRRGFPDHAVRLLAQWMPAVEGRPEEVVYRYHLGVAHEMCAHRFDAFRQYQRAFLSFPGSHFAVQAKDRATAMGFR